MNPIHFHGKAWIVIIVACLVCNINSLASESPTPDMVDISACNIDTIVYEMINDESYNQNQELIACHTALVNGNHWISPELLANLIRPITKYMICHKQPHTSKTIKYPAPVAPESPFHKIALLLYASLLQPFVNGAKSFLWIFR